ENTGSQPAETGGGASPDADVPEHPRQCVLLRGHYDRAEPLYAQILEICRQKLGDSHPLMPMARHNLGVCYRAVGKYAQAEQLYLKTLEVSRQKGDAETVETLTT